MASGAKSAPFGQHGTKIVDAYLSKECRIFQGFEDGAIEQIPAVDDPFNTIIEFYLKLVVFQCFNVNYLFHEGSISQS